MSSSACLPNRLNELVESVVQCAFRSAVACSGITKHATPQRTVQELLGHRDVRTTMIYTYVLNRPGLGVTSPADEMG